MRFELSSKSQSSFYFYMNFLFIFYRGGRRYSIPLFHQPTKRSENGSLIPVVFSFSYIHSLSGLFPILSMRHPILFRLSFLVPSLVWSVPLWSFVCRDDHPAFDLPFCDSTLGLEERVGDYVYRIPVTHQISMMSHHAAGYAPLGIPPYQWWSEGLHGPFEPCVDYKNQTRCATSFPCPSGLGNSFNTTLFHQIGAAIGVEGRAISQLRNHNMAIGDGLTYWSPNVNLQRDPRWGRNQEAPGEDPLLTSLYARNFVEGLQQQHNSSTNNISGDDQLQVAACCKHFVGNSLENWMGHTRHNFDARISEADLHNYYYRPFQECVQAGAVGVMCSYNAVNGSPACLNDDLLKKTLREKWAFDGYLVTDCGALADTITGHGAAKDPVDSSAKAKNASVDVNCGDVFRNGLLQAYQEGLVQESTITDSFRRLARIQFRLGLFDEKKYQPGRAIKTVGSHDSLALEAALQSIVLLKHQEGILPIDPNQRIAVIGPHVFGREVFLSNYHGDVCPNSDSNYTCIESPVEALSKIAHNPINATLGCHVADTDLNEIDKAVDSAKQADRVVLLVGLDQTQEREEKDRTETSLPGLQQELVHAILRVASEKTIIVLVHGGAISLGDDTIDEAPAILSASYGGQLASRALAQVLFGRYNPTGKLAATMYRASYVDEIPLTEMGLNVGVGRTHMYYTGSPEFVFGHGLSYSNWGIEWNQAESRFRLDATTRSSLKVDINVTNLGPTKGSQNVLLFWRPGESSRVRQMLAGFQGTSLLDVGKSEVLEFKIDYQTFAMWQENIGSSITVAGMYELEARASNISTTAFIRIFALPDEEQEAITK